MAGRERLETAIELIVLELFAARISRQREISYGAAESPVKKIDDRYSRVALDACFAGALRWDQEAAVTAMFDHDAGVLRAPMAFGKTVTAAGAGASIAFQPKRTTSPFLCTVISACSAPPCGNTSTAGVLALGVGLRSFHVHAPVRVEVRTLQDRSPRVGNGLLD